MQLFSRKIEICQSGALEGMYDVHTHILPGVDDGVRSTDETLKILALYEGLGVKNLTMTPHIMANIPQSISDLKLRFDTLKSDYKGAIELHLGAEYMLDSDFFELIDSGNTLPLFKNHLLVEFSFAQPTMNPTNCIERVMQSGYFAILAHPERYLYLEPNFYSQLKSAGALFQLNITSLAGQYGSRVRERAEWLLKRGMYDFVGTDIHNLESHKKHFDTKINRKLIVKIRDLSAKAEELVNQY